MITFPSQARPQKGSLPSYVPLLRGLTMGGRRKRGLSSRERTVWGAAGGRRKRGLSSRERRERGRCGWEAAAVLHERRDLENGCRVRGQRGRVRQRGAVSDLLLAGWCRADHARRLRRDQHGGAETPGA